MFSIENGTIKLTRGDTARFNVSITNASNNTAYTLAADDKLTMTVRKNLKQASNEYLFKKEITGASTFLINPSDTSSATFSKYLYDVQLTKANGEVYTVIGPETFEILKEVTY